MHVRGGDAWNEYRPTLLKVVGANQSADGSWKGSDNEGRYYGANYCTAMAILALTVDGYRPLPEKPKD
jgi:hypothetical protein